MRKAQITLPVLYAAMFVVLFALSFTTEGPTELFQVAVFGSYPLGLLVPDDSGFSTLLLYLAAGIVQWTIVGLCLNRMLRPSGHG